MTHIYKTYYRYWGHFDCGRIEPGTDLTVTGQIVPSQIDPKSHRPPDQIV